MTEDGQGRTAGHVLLCGELASHRGTHAEHPKEAGADPLLIRETGLLVHDQIHASSPVREDGRLSAKGRRGNRLPGSPVDRVAAVRAAWRAELHPHEREA